MIQEIKNNRKLYIILIVVQIVAVLGLSIYLFQRPVNNYVFPVTEGTPKAGNIYEAGYDLNNTDGDLLEEDEKIFFNIGMPVKKGSYTFTVKYRSSNPSTVSLYSNSNDRAVHCDELNLTHVPMEIPGSYGFDYGFDYVPGYSYSNAFFTKDVEDVDMYVRYSGYGAFFIESVELIGNRNYILPIMIFSIFILLLCDLLVLLYRSDKEKKLFNRIAILTLFGVIVSIPILFKEGSLLHDLDFFMYRIVGLAEGLKDGQFPVRIHPCTLNGYGYAVSQFYPELLLYPFAVLRLLGFSLKFATGALTLSVNIATSFVAYYSVDRVYKNKTTAYIASFLYTFAGYRLVDVYVRGAAGEYFAMIFLPLIVAGIYIIVIEEGSLIPLTLGLIGILNSHLLSCEMAGIFALLFALLCYKKVFRKNAIINLIKSVVISLLTSAYFLIPFIYISKSDTFMVYEANAYETSDNMLSFSSFFTGDYRISGAIVVLALVSIGILLVDSKEKDDYRNLKIVCFILGMVALFMTTSAFPWNLIEKTGGMFASIFCMVQFPWRYISIATVLLLFSGCGALEYCINKSKYMKLIIPVVVALVSFTFTTVILSFVSINKNTNDKYTYYDFGGISSMGGVSSGEYVPVNFDYEILDRTIEELNAIKNQGVDTGLNIESVIKSGTKSTIVVSNTSGEDRILFIPQTFYKGYIVSNAIEDPNGLEPSLYETESGTIGVIVPNGYYNGIHIEYKKPAVYVASEFITLIMIALLVLVPFYRKKKHFNRSIS